MQRTKPHPYRRCPEKEGTAAARKAATAQVDRGGAKTEKEGMRSITTTTRRPLLLLL